MAFIFAEFSVVLSGANRKHSFYQEKVDVATS